MNTTTSADGTTIAFDRQGSGIPVVFVSGAFNDRHTCAPLAAAFGDGYTVITYDRRGRGDSTDTAPYSIEKELDDLDAVIGGAGGPAVVFGFSSGANLALMAAARGSKISHVAMYEPPFALDPSDRRAPADLPARLATMIAEGRRADAVTTFQLEGIGLAPDMVAGIRQSPYWPQLEAIAPTVVYDATITVEPLHRPTASMKAVQVPVLVITGEETWPSLKKTAQALPGLLADATHVDVPGGANHEIPPAETAAAVKRFLDGAGPVAVIGLVLP